MGLLACTLLLVVLAVWLLSLRPGITQSNYERIEVGMTQQEVEVLLAGPPGVRVGLHWAALLENGMVQIGHTQLVWADDHAGIRVHFDEEGRVAVKQWVPRYGNFWDRALGWVKR